MEIVHKYFPELTAVQVQKFSKLQKLYEEWNERINVISRKDIDQLYQRHILHSLSIAKYIKFDAGTRILDVGTGGGFPGIPLAIMFPEASFYLVDSIGKKIKVVNAISETINLKNLIAEQKRAENVTREFDYVVSRAVTQMPVFVDWVKKCIRSAKPGTGIIALKGGELHEELKSIPYKKTIIPISDYFSEEFFETKSIVHIFF